MSALYKSFTYLHTYNFQVWLVSQTTQKQRQWTRLTARYSSRPWNPGEPAPDQSEIHIIHSPPLTHRLHRKSSETVASIILQTKCSSWHQTNSIRALEAKVWCIPNANLKAVFQIKTVHQLLIDFPSLHCSNPVHPHETSRNFQYTTMHHPGKSVTRRQ